MLDTTHHADANLKYSYVAGLKTLAVRNVELAELMVRDAQMNNQGGRIDRPKLVFSSNGQGISLAHTDKRFMEAMLKADIIHADGMSVVIGSRLFTKIGLPERIATTDFFHYAAKAGQDSGLSFFILGGSEQQNELAVAKIKLLYPKLRIAGRRNGYFSTEEDAEVCQEIVASGADVLWVGLGKPLQEYWAVRNADRLRGVAWLKTCGGLYSFLAGEVTRAPELIQRFGLEWLWRTAQDPKRLALRYLSTNPHAMFKIMMSWRLGN